jgi:hypothetical protein
MVLLAQLTPVLRMNPQRCGGTKILFLSTRLATPKARRPARRGGCILEIAPAENRQLES